MSLISDSLKKRFSSLKVHTSIHRHKQLSIAKELRAISHSITPADSRDTYGKGGSIQAFEQQLCKLFSKPSALFLPTGTLAQCAALKCYSEKSGRSTVGLHPTSHLLLHEHRAIEALWGLNVFEIGRYNDVLSFKDLQQLNPELTAAIIVEAPMREIGGAMPSWDELVKMRAWCKEHNINMHLDGARIWQSTVFYERSLADIAALFDSLYLSFYKDLGGIFGAALLGPPKLLEQARIWSRRAGGNPITMYPEVIAARAGLEKYLVQMPELVTYTVQLVTKLRANGIKVIPDEPQAAMFHIEFTVDAESLTRRIVSYAEKTGILVLPMPRSGDKTSCICEVAVGDQAIAYEPEFWCKHINDCLA